jgi:hypothetical protein
VREEKKWDPGNLFFLGRKKRVSRTSKRKTEILSKEVFAVSSACGFHSFRIKWVQAYEVED